MATKKTVHNASDATELSGRPSAELVRMSKVATADLRGAVPAWCKKDTWYYIAPSEVSHYRLHLGVTATLVYVEET